MTDLDGAGIVVCLVQQDGVRDGSDERARRRLDEGAHRVPAEAVHDATQLVRVPRVQRLCASTRSKRLFEDIIIRSWRCLHTTHFKFFPDSIVHFVQIKSPYRQHRDCGWLVFKGNNFETAPTPNERSWFSTSDERGEAKPVDEDVVLLGAAREELSDHVEIRASFPRLVQHVLQRFRALRFSSDWWRRQQS